MSLDEAIKYTEEVVKKYEKKLEVYENIEDEDKLLFIEEETECRLCASELQQLVEWLKELKALRKLCTSKAFDMAIEALGQTDMLDKIRAEIEGYKSATDYAISEDELTIEGMKKAYTNCLEIIDEYTDHDRESGDEE